MTPDQLRRIAQAATSGPWTVEQEIEETDFGKIKIFSVDPVTAFSWYDDSAMAHTALDTLEEADAEFIATFNPQRVLEMIDTLRGAEIRLDHAKTVIDRLQTRLAAVEQIADAIEEHDAPFEASPTAQWIRKAARGE